MITMRFILLLLLATSCIQPPRKTDLLRNQIEQIVAGKDALVGVSIIGNHGADTLSIHGNRRFPMQSVFKFHIGLAIMAEVDKGRLSLDEAIDIGKDDFLPAEFWSPLRDEHPEGGRFTMRTLLEYSVSHSDNTACDVLIARHGSPRTVQDYIRKSGIEEIQITFNEQVMQSRWENMFENWTTPNAASETIRLFYENHGPLLSEASHEFFWAINKQTTTGKNRIKGLLPEGTVVAHKTGWSGTHPETGIIAAVNDIGIVFLPDGEYFILSVFVSESKESFETNERIIADIAKAAYDHFAASSRE
jgi:beta-lactamase class A/beta-lactamase class A VEB